MSRFPLYIDMKGRKVILVGGGAVALRKACVLVDFGADLHIVSPELDEGFDVLIQKGLITFEKQSVTVDTFELPASVFMVICASDNRKLNQEIAEYCRERQIWVDCADSETASSCLFPAVVRRGDIVIGISTSGGVPALAKSIRKKIERLVPEWYEDLACGLRAKREELKQSFLSAEEKRKILNEMIEEAERRHPE